MSNFLYSILERHSLSNLLTFTILAIISIMVQFAIFYSIRKRYSLFTKPITKSLFTLQVLLIFFMMLNVILISYLVVQIMLQSAYDTNIFKFIIFSNYFFALTNMGMLVYYLFSWFKRNRSIVMLVYFMAFSVFIINEIGSILILILST